jgi:N-acetylglutamate synthase-like GNAT family acetyltransferase
MLIVRPYRPGDAERVVALVLGIQRGEFGMSITAEDQPDLVDVQSFYQQGSGNFWVAAEDEEIVGTIGLLDIAGGHGALRKMFVAPDWRGPEHRVGTRLLETLVAWASERGLGEIYLGTTDWFHAAHRFYEREGFDRVDPEKLPAAFPIMAVDTRFYRRAIGSI